MEVGGSSSVRCERQGGSGDLVLVAGVGWVGALITVIPKFLFSGTVVFCIYLLIFGVEVYSKGDFLFF